MPIRPIIQDNANTTKLMRYCKEHENDECKILTKEEEQDLIKKWAKKDPDKLRQMLIMHNIALVFNVATKWMSATRSYDDLVQRGLNGLAIAASKFKFSQKKTKFATYAYRWVYKYIFDTYWNENKRKDVANEAISLDSAISDYASNSKSSESDSGEMGNYLENHLDPNQAGAIVSTETQMEQNAMSRLYDSMRKYMLTSDFTDIDRTVFNGAFVENLTLARISSDNDIPRKEVKASYDKILEYMKAKLAGAGVHSMADVY